jgi:hypothetical protein
LEAADWEINGLFSLSDRQVLPVDHMLLHTVNLTKQPLQLSGIPPDCGTGTPEPLAATLRTQDQLTNSGQTEESCDSKLKVANIQSYARERDRVQSPFHHCNICVGVSWQEHAIWCSHR